MITLALETATTAAAVAVLDDDVVLAEAVASVDRHHTESLLPCAAELLGSLGLGVGEVERIVVDVGPGLFTGLRVGLATARSLAAGRDVLPVVLVELRSLSLGDLLRLPRCRDLRHVVLVHHLLQDLVAQEVAQLQPLVVARDPVLEDIQEGLVVDLEDALRECPDELEGRGSLGHLDVQLAGQLGKEGGAQVVEAMPCGLLHQRPHPVEEAGDLDRGGLQRLAASDGTH